MPANILIVEDEFLIAIEMEEVLRELGHASVGIADNRGAALALANQDVDVALVDVNLVDGATGPEIGAQLVDEYGIDVIFITANPAQLGKGVKGTLGAVEKPVDFHELAEVLDYAIAVKAHAGSPTPPARLMLFDAA